MGAYISKFKGSEIDNELSYVKNTVRQKMPIVDTMDTKLTELSAKVNGKTLIQKALKYESEPFEIFQELEKGKEYLFRATIPCGIEYFNTAGQYIHLFDNKSETTFICPVDYDESKSQYVKRYVSENGEMSILTSGLEDKLQEQISDLLDEITDIRPKVDGISKEYVDGVDYQKILGSIRNDGSVDATATSFWYSTPIKVNAGDIVHISKRYAAGNAVLWETDEQNSFHKMLVKNMDGVNEISYVVDNDKYVNVCYLSGDTNYRVIIARGGIKEERNEAVSQAISRNTNTMPTSRTYKMPIALKNAILVDNMSAAVNARFERQKMLNEVAAFKRKGIAPVRSGYCGYDDRGGSIVHNTISWEIYENGILYISGYGKMYDYVKGVSQGMNKAELNARQAESPYLWYYYLVQDGVTYREYDDNHNVMYTYPAPFKHRVYNEIEGENLNSETGKYVGYAAPWYSYRSEIDFVEYTSQEHYDEFNPNHIVYDRICIDEDLSNGGITRIGDWAFYRATCDTLVLPSRLTEIGRWGVRYSPTIRTLVMDNLVTTLEDHAISRMENMNHLILSDAITKIDFYGLAQNERLRIIDLPSIVETVDFATYNNPNLEHIAIGNGLAELTRQNFTPCRKVLSIQLGDNLQSIGSNACGLMDLEELHIPATITSFSTSAGLKSFDGTSVNCLYLNNEYAQTLITSLPAFAAANYIFIKADVEVNSYILSNYDYTGIHDGYKRFVKRPTLVA